MIHFLRSVELLFGAAALAVLHWQGLVFLADTMPFGNGGLLPVAALFCAAILIFSLIFRRPGECESRTAAVLAALALWQFRDFLAVDTAVAWWCTCAAAALIAGGVTAAFLRGCREHGLAAGAGYAAAMGALAFLAWEMPWELWHNREWSFVVAALGIIAVGVASTVGVRFSKGHIVWLGLIFLAAGGIYQGVDHYDGWRTLLRERYAASRQTVDGRRFYQPNEDGRSVTVSRANHTVAAGYPSDMAYRPSMLPALLQFSSHNLQVLLVAAPLSSLIDPAGSAIWVDHVDFLSRDPALAATEPLYDLSAYVRCIGSDYRLDGPYDLIILAEGDPTPYIGHLTAAGVIAATPEIDQAPLQKAFRYAMPAPGPGGVTLYSNRELEDDLAQLDANMRLLTMDRTPPPLPYGILEILYAADIHLPPASPQTPSRAAVRSPDYAAWTALPEWRGILGRWWLWLIAAALFAVCRTGRFLAERWSDWYAFFSDADVGFAAGAGLAVAAVALSVLAMPLYVCAALPGLAALAFLPRATVTTGLRIALQALIWLAPAAAAVTMTFDPWIAFWIAAAGAMLALNLWRNSRAAGTGYAASRLWLGVAAGLGLCLLTLSVPAGLCWYALAVLLWRRIVF